MEKELLIARGIIKNAFVYDDLENDKIDIYKRFELYFKKRFYDYAELFNIANPCFYIFNDVRCNAFATKINNYNIISITNGYPILFEQKFKAPFLENFILAGILNENLISNAYVDLAKNTDFIIEDFFLNCSYIFTFSHEFQHILQFNNDNFTNKVHEFQEQLLNNQFDFRRHVWEFDADRMASFEVLKYAFSEFRKLKNKSNEMLKVVFFITCATMIITNFLFYFGISNQITMPLSINKVEFYLENNSHQHPLVRCLNILEYFYDNISNDFPQLHIDIQELLNNVLGIAKIYFDALLPQNNAIELIFQDLNLHLNEINYYNQKLYDAAIKDAAINKILTSRKIDFS